MEQALKKMYDSEINVSISSFWDGGWRVRVGDEMNGYQPEREIWCDFEEIVPFLQDLIREYYPQSKYAHSLLPWYKRLLNPWKPIKVGGLQDK